MSKFTHTRRSSDREPGPFPFQLVLAFMGIGVLCGIVLTLWWLAR